MEKVKTATGKEFDCSDFSVIETPNRAYIRITSASLATVATIFSDPRETVQLWHGDQYLAHHTHLVAIVPEEGCIRVVLRKE